MKRPTRHVHIHWSLVLGMGLLLLASGCKDQSPVGEDFGVELLEPLLVSWGPDENYHASSGAALFISARASSRVDWRVEITSDTGGRVVRDDRIIQTRLGFTEALPFRVSSHTPDVFSTGDVVTVRVFTNPEIKPSQAERGVFQFVIHP